MGLCLYKVDSRGPETEKTVFLPRDADDTGLMPARHSSGCTQQRLHTCKAGVIRKGLKSQDYQEDPEICFSPILK